ncbi:MAG: hypothetical protein QM753_16830 [Thermomicrobiales bacterium]
MALRINSDNEARLIAFVNDGRFENVDDVLAMALDLLSEHQAHAALRAEIAAGIADIRAGAVMEADDAFWASLDEEVDRHRSAHAPVVDSCNAGCTHQEVMHGRHSTPLPARRHH